MSILNLPPDAVLVTISVQSYRPGEASDPLHVVAQGFTSGGDPYSVTYVCDTQTQLAAAFVELAAAVMAPP
jgi:hypothetical protein